MVGRILHVIAGTSDESRENIVYRRHRLARHLSLQPNTAGVFWVSASARGASSSEGGRADELPSSVRRFALPLARRLEAYTEVRQKPHAEPILAAVRQHPADACVLWYTIPALSYLLRSSIWDAVVYDCSDNWGGLEPGPKLRGLLGQAMRRRSEQRIVSGADLLFASSRFLAERLRTRHGKDALLIENGVDGVFFEESRADPSPVPLPPRPRLGFVGSMKSHKIDFDLLRTVAATVPEWSFVLAGPRSERHGPFDSLLDLPNVHWLGYVPPAGIPALMRQLDVGLLPYREAPFNEGVFPLKFFEYIASDLPVVGCGLPSTTGYVEEGIYVHTTSTVESFIEGCRRALKWPAGLPRRAVLARESEWNARLERMHRTVVDYLEAARSNRERPARG